MSEQQPQPTSAETGSVSAASDAKAQSASAPVMAESPALAPDQELTAPEADAKIEPKTEPKLEAPKVEAPKAEVKAEKAEAPRNVMIMSPGERIWSGEAKVSKPAAPMRRVAAVVAVVAVVGFAAVAGAIGGALATSDLRNGKSAEAAAAGNGSVEAAIARIDADILALKASVEQNAKLGVTHFNKTSDRLDKFEKAQADPATKLARLSEEVSKLRAAQASASAPAAAVASAAPVQLAAAPATTTVPKDVTGSVTPPAAAAAAAPAAPPKVEVGRLPTVDGWVLREVGRGSALIESRRGLFEVFAGDPVPGLGRVDAIRKQDGRWVVVTSKGLIVAR